MRCNNLLIAKTFLNLTQVILQTQTKFCTLRQPDGQALTYLIREHEEFHLLTDLTVVALLGLLQHLKILVEHFLLREGDTIQTLHLLTVCITTPESTCYRGQLHSLDLACIHEVRTTTQIGEITLCISGDRTVFKILLDVLALVGLTIGTKLLKSVCLGNLTTNNGFFLRSQLLHLCFNLGEVALLDALAILQQHIIEETILDSRSETELYARIQLLQCLCQQMG